MTGDRLISAADTMLRTLFSAPAATRPNPADNREHADLLPPDALRAQRLMRVNHTGEVCAQALYQGQSMTARDAHLRATFAKAAEEEIDHLAWCQQRIDHLGGKTSALNPLFYAGSFAIGALTGLAGDKVSAAFLAETEHQVARHLDVHIEKLPAGDEKSRAVLAQMREDELEHAKTAENIHPRRLPLAARRIMQTMSKVMTRTTYWI